MYRVEFAYFGTVKAQPRPRFTSKGKPYDPKPAADYKKAIAAAYKEQCGAFMFADDLPLAMHITIARHLPASKQRKTRSVVEPDTGKPDIDNYAKAVMDALNGVAYHDDSQIVRLVIDKKPRRKQPFDEDALEVLIEEIVDAY